MQTREKSSFIQVIFSEIKSQNEESFGGSEIIISCQHQQTYEIVFASFIGRLLRKNSLHLNILCLKIKYLFTRTDKASLFYVILDIWIRIRQTQQAVKAFCCSVETNICANNSNI